MSKFSPSERGPSVKTMKDSMLFADPPLTTFSQGVFRLGRRIFRNRAGILAIQRGTGHFRQHKPSSNKEQTKAIKIKVGLAEIRYAVNNICVSLRITNHGKRLFLKHSPRVRAVLSIFSQQTEAYL